MVLRSPDCQAALFPPEPAEPGWALLEEGADALFEIGTTEALPHQAARLTLGWAQ